MKNTFLYYFFSHNHLNISNGSIVFLWLLLTATDVIVCGGFSVNVLLFWLKVAWRLAFLPLSLPATPHTQNETNSEWVPQQVASSSSSPPSFPSLFMVHSWPGHANSCKGKLLWNQPNKNDKTEIAPNYVIQVHSCSLRPNWNYTINFLSNFLRSTFSRHFFATFAEFFTAYVYLYFFFHTSKRHPKNLIRFLCCLLAGFTPVHTTDLKKRLIVAEKIKGP